jgi:hypothetical protein
VANPAHEDALAIGGQALDQEDHKGCDRDRPQQTGVLTAEDVVDDRLDQLGKGAGRDRHQGAAEEGGQDGAHIGAQVVAQQPADQGLAGVVKPDRFQGCLRRGQGVPATRENPPGP